MKTDRAIVIGGGPSLFDFDFDWLSEGYRIGANKAGWLAKCDAMVSLDRNFHNHFARDIVAFPGRKIIATPEGGDLPGVEYWKRDRRDGLSETAGELRGSNSGYAALNLAYLLRFKEIWLLGFDFTWVNGRSHFHDGYAHQNSRTHTMLAQWVRAFDDAAQQLKDAGVTVTNFVGPAGSRVTQFPKRPLNDAYRA